MSRVHGGIKFRVGFSYGGNISGSGSHGGGTVTFFGGKALSAVVLYVSVDTG
ncbi:hypothetical protein AMATHDRAFT_69964 [Amanita thiersii Skay4041]|uniref:Uncharacterized protein n=1 Tax=Amanita thiersii Skay4041 TaxID=703135 RepID=A0A2A9NFI3_9AGAR|nr:hypothetical protein AMATHDRAFT_69964 [Amanita thiersii Skay4041]